MNDQPRTPLKDKPLRLPGQSLEEERRKLFEDKLEVPAIAAMMWVAIAAIEWWRYVTDQPPKPMLFTLMAVGAIAFVIWRFRYVRPKIRMIKQAIEGEKAVGQFLERLREDGYRVFHDVVAPGFNVDHVLIGPAGVFSIETKTWSKLAQGNARVVCQGDQLRVGALAPDRDPIIQAKAQAGWLRQVLSESTGRTFEVRPVVLFPGWYVEADESSRRHAWVLEPKALPAFLQHQPARLAPEDAALAAYHLSRFIRSGER